MGMWQIAFSIPRYYMHGAVSEIKVHKSEVSYLVN